MFRSTSKLSSSRLVLGALTAAAALAVATSPTFADLTHRYSFTTDASDSVGGANGALVNSATVSGGQLQLNNPNFAPGGKGNPDPNGYATLPANILPSSGSATIEQWFTFTGSGFFSEGYTFTNAADTDTPTAGQYLMGVISAPQPATPPGGPNTGGSHVVEGPNGNNPGPETTAFETTPGIGAGGGGFLDDGETFMMATVIDSSAGDANTTLSFYLFDISAGGVGGLQQTITGVPLDAFSFTNAYLGRSAFTNDDATSGSVDEFRIYNDAQSANQIAADFAAGPNAVVGTPEPASLTLLAVGGLALINRRRRA